MTSQENDPTLDVDKAWLLRVETIERFEEHWRTGEPEITAYLSPQGTHGRIELLSEIVKVDLEHRWVRGQAVSVEHYVGRFPELEVNGAPSTDLILEELRVRLSLGRPASTDELETRFPGRVEQLVRLSAASESQQTIHPSQSGSGSRKGNVPTSLGRYELREQVGRGGFATVYRGWDPTLQREVAIKVPRPEFLEGESSRNRTLREAQSAARLRHPAIVPIHEVASEGDITYIVYEFMPGATLAQKLQETPPSPAQAATWIARVADALYYAHSCGIVHRDVKPANVMMDRDGQPVLADFGLALQTDAVATLTQQGDLMGTPAYMSPEQARGQGHDVDARSDVYSLGVTLYELLTGQTPFPGGGLSVLHSVVHHEPKAPRLVKPGIPADMETICLKAMAKEPQRRYQSAGEMADDLRRYLRNEPIQARRIGLAGRVARWCRRNPALAGTIMVSVVALAVLASASYWRVLQERNRFLTERETAVANLYDSLVRESRAIRLARGTGYRAAVWDRIQQAMALDTPARDLESLRQEAVVCLGDFVGAEPVVWQRPAEISGWISAVAIDPSGTILAVAFTDIIQLREAATGKVVAEFHDHKSGVYAMDFSADGQTLVSMDDSGVIKVRSAPGSETGLNNVDAGAETAKEKLQNLFRSTLQQLTTPRAPTVEDRSNDSKATADSGGWTVRREIQGVMGAERSQVVAVSCMLSPDGRHLMACSKGEDRVRMWNVATGEVDFEFRGLNQEPFVRAAISADGQTLVGAYRTAEIDGVVIWDVPSRELVKTLPVSRQGIVDVTFSGDGKFLACACTEGTYIFESAGWTQRTMVRSDDQFFTVAFHPEQPIVAVPSSRTNSVRLWDVIGNREVALLDHPGGPHSVAFAPNGSSLVSATNDTVRLWNLSGSGEKRELAAHQGIVNTVRFSPNGRLLASGGADTKVRLWDAATLRPLSQFSLSPTALGKVNSVAFSPDSKRLAAVDWSGTVAVFDVSSPESPQRSSTLLHYEKPELGTLLFDVTFSPNGEFVAVAGQFGVWVWRGDERIATPTEKAAITVRFSPNSERLLWRQQVQGKMGFWNLAAARMEQLPPTAKTDGSFTFTEDGRLLTVNGRKKSEKTPILHQIDLKTGESSELFWSSVPRLLSELDFGSGFALTPDESWLALAGANVSVWDLKSRKLILVLPAEATPVNTLDFTPDHSRLALGLTDGTVSVWDLPAVREQLARIGLDW